MHISYSHLHGLPFSLELIPKDRFPNLNFQPFEIAIFFLSRETILSFFINHIWCLAVSTLYIKKVFTMYLLGLFQQYFKQHEYQIKSKNI